MVPEKLHSILVHSVTCRPYVPLRGGFRWSKVCSVAGMPRAVLLSERSHHLASKHLFWHRWFYKYEPAIIFDL